MKLKKNIFLLVFIVSWFVLYNTSKSQDDFLAFVKLKDIFLDDPSSISFDITINRNSDEWYYLANGTFNIRFDTSNFSLFPNTNLQAEVLNTGLPMATQIGPYIMPENGYVIESQIYGNRISFTVMGPENYNECVGVSREEDLRVGRFRVFTDNGTPIPPQIEWVSPISIYQALAFKLERDTTDIVSGRDYPEDDNISLIDDDYQLADFQQEQSATSGLRLDYFNVRYVGSMEIGIQWASLEEYFNRGFTLLRAEKLNPLTDLTIDDYKDTVFTWRPESEFYNELMLSQGNTRDGFVYDPVFNVVDFRNISYCYAIIGTIYDVQTREEYDVFLDSDCVSIPNAVIVSAVPSENPFSDKTTITYEVDDDVYLTAIVRDALGKRVAELRDDQTGELLQNAVVEKGVHETTFFAPGLASQGYYEIILMAYPINDPNVEVSRAIVKTQLVKPN